MQNPHERYFCRACATEGLTSEARALVGEYLASLKPEDCVPDDEYEHRLRQCGLCSSLAGGDTCGHCGCLVLVRAKKKGQGCPHPAGSRWP